MYILAQSIFENTENLDIIHGKPALQLSYTGGTLAETVELVFYDCMAIHLIFRFILGVT